MSPLAERISAVIDRYGMLAGVARLGVAVSGGADSVCLLEILRELASSRHLTLTVLHLDHGLRGEESKRDAEFVAAIADRLGLPALVRTADLSTCRGNLEEAGRDARLRFFGEVMAGGVVERVALGHTRRDQAETVLFRLLRGAGTAGLAGILPITREGIVRPLLETGRQEIEEYLRARHIPWREDATNASPRFARNRIRHQLLPQLEREWNPQLELGLARMAECARAEEAYWEDQLHDAIAPPGSDGSIILSAAELRRLPEAAARRVVRRAIERAKGGLRGIGFAHVEAVLALARRPEGRGRAEAAGVEIRRSFDHVRVARRGGMRALPFCFPVTPPAQVTLPGPGAPGICLELLENPETTLLSFCVYNGGMGCLDWRRVAAPLELRNWRPGDRFQLAGEAGSRKLKDLLQLARIPSWEREQWPVLADGARVLWTRRFGVAADAAACASSRVVLRIREVAAGTAPNSESDAY